MMSEERIIESYGKLEPQLINLLLLQRHYWWRDYGENLVKELDFLGVHIYPLWEGEGIENGMSFTIEGIENIIKVYPDKRIAILEAGWASIADEFGDRSNELNQQVYYNQLKQWSEDNNVTVFFFEAFDEPWKGNDNSPNAAEKNWGVYYENRTPKLVLRD